MDSRALVSAVSLAQADLQDLAAFRASPELLETVAYLVSLELETLAQADSPGPQDSLEHSPDLAETVEQAVIAGLQDSLEHSQASVEFPDIQA